MRKIVKNGKMKGKGSREKYWKTKNTSVTLFTTKKIFSQVTTRLKNTNDYTLILKEENEGIGSYLKRVETICNKDIDILFVNTIQESLKEGTSVN